jgi:hypothetical protein
MSISDIGCLGLSSWKSYFNQSLYLRYSSTDDDDDDDDDGDNRLLLHVKPPLVTVADVSFSGSRIVFL